MAAGENVNANDLLDQADQHFRAGRVQQAADLLVRAADLEPDNPQILRGLGIALVTLDRAPDALPALHRLTQIRSADCATFHQLGDALAFAGDLPAAVAALRRSIALKNDYAPAWARLATVLREQHDDAGALEAFQHAAGLDPHPDIIANLADALMTVCRPEEAVEPLRDALRRDRMHIASRVNLSCAYMRLGQAEEAQAELEEVLRQQPAMARAHYYHALALLKRGDLARGWKEFEWRLRLPPVDSAQKIDRALPRWRGEDLSHRSILLHAEQGFGDAIQFARFVPAVLARALDDNGKVIVAAHRSLWRLLKSSMPAIADFMQPGDDLPGGISFQCPLMSLPLVFGTTMETIPAAVPYLAAPADLLAQWKEKLAGTSGVKIGLSWRGRPTNSLNRYRSCRLDDLAPLFDLSGVTLFTLQKDGDPLDRATGSRFSDRLIDHTADLHDWADTAALVSALDCVVSIDSAPLHLAGALGRPALALLSRGADWRWHVDRSDSPWYPTMRLFRQRKVGRWDDVVARVAAEISAQSGRNS